MPPFYNYGWLSKYQHPLPIRKNFNRKNFDREIGTLKTMSSMWKEFFESQAATYDQNPFTQHTTSEIDFLLSLYPLAPGARILDVGCGTGRHSIELAKRGFRVTGLDFSPAMLSEARKKAEGLDIEWIEADAVQFELDRTFDAAFCLCEGGPGLIQRGDDPVKHEMAIFKNIEHHLNPSAPFVLTCLNGYSIIRQLKDEFIGDGRFNPSTMISSYVDEWDLPEGTKQIQIFERLFIAPEVVRMLTDSGFKVDAVYGGTAGYWGKRPLSLDEVEAMFVCRKLPH